ncbi:MAG: ferritin-like domain-containing protein [Pseudomonadota bacterium]
MTVQPVYHQGWKLDEVRWDAFEPAAVDPTLLAAIKAAALVEYNAPDYVTYLKRVFRGSPTDTLDWIERWGAEESQHGRALGRWAEIADPSFKLEDAFARFRKGYTPAHFTDSQADGSVRGSRRGEMVARCVVESGTSSYYTAIRDATDEPLLKEIAGRIAADEYRHYKLFYDTLNKQDEPEMTFWRKLWVAVGRVRESEDDELAYAYYCANVPPQEEGARPYDRALYSRLAARTGMTIYRRQHIQRLVQMVAKVIGANPHGMLANLGGALLWRMMQKKAAAAA